MRLILNSCSSSIDSRNAVTNNIQSFNSSIKVCVALVKMIGETHEHGHGNDAISVRSNSGLHAVTVSNLFA
jgi:hypothetical protein